MEQIIVTACVGMVGGIGVKVVYDMLAKKNGNGKVPIECKLKLDRLMADHDNYYKYMSDQAKERVESGVYLKELCTTNKDILKELQANGKRLESIKNNH